jgi:hypothetical protein
MWAERSASKLAVGIAAVLVGLAAVSEAWAAPPWVDRAITLPRGDWAFDLGLGLGHVPNNLGPGFNFEFGVGLTREIELGLRTGLRFNDDAIRAGADAYGRPFDTETYGTGNAAMANPEILLRGALIRGQVVELGLEGRMYLPFSRGFGLMAGMPLAFHLGRSVRIDTGVYVPILFYDPGEAFISIPFHLWIQVTDRLWLGPLTGVRFHQHVGDRFAPYPGDEVAVPLGFGLGYSFARNFDFKTWILFHDISRRDPPVPEPIDRHYWGVGAGIEIRIE